MIDTQWSEIKRIATSKNLPVQWVQNGNNYLIALVDGPFTLMCTLPVVAENDDTMDFETNFKVQGNSKIDTKQTSIISQPDPAPFAVPTYRTKRNATSSTISVQPGSDQDIQFQLTAERYISGGDLIIENAEFGDYVTAEVEDIDGVIPAPYRAALCENWPIVSSYIEKEYVKVGVPGSIQAGSISIHDISTYPLNAKITPGLYLCVHYYAVNSGITRRLAVNYHLTRKL